MLIRIDKDVSFVVPDDSILAATATLLDAGLVDCSAYTSCRLVGARWRASPAPCSHVHLDQSTSIRLFKQSETLWHLDLPSLPLLKQLVAAEAARRDIGDREYQQKDKDPLGRHKSRSSPELSSVRVPTASRLIEAYILLMVRDQQKIYRCLWSSMLAYVQLYVEGSGLIVREDLEPWALDLYDTMFEESGYVLREKLEKLGKDRDLVPRRSAEAPML